MTTPPPQPLPYQTPPPPGGGILCPKCGGASAKPVSFTWWGGLIGPKLLNHTKCHVCRYTFNRKTGQPNTTAIVIYTVVVLVIALALGLFAAFSR